MGKIVAGSGRKKDRRLFKKVINTLAKKVNKTKDISILTDGERPQENLLFEIRSIMLKNDQGTAPR